MSACHHTAKAFPYLNFYFRKQAEGDYDVVTGKRYEGDGGV